MMDKPIRSSTTSIQRCGIVGSASVLTLLLIVSSLATPGVQGFQKNRPAPDDQTIKLGATLVQVPTVVTDREGKAVPDLPKTDFTVYEDGRRQDISLFDAVKQPFTAVVVLDTSNSASDRLAAIQKTAVTFLKQIRADDRAMVISFDNEVRELTEFTSDRQTLEKAILATESGFGKLLYEATALALKKLADVEGRRAVILFSDCVDMRSIDESADSVARLAEQTGAAMYVVQFETRWWIEADARKRQTEQARSRVPFEVDGRIPLPPDLGGPDTNAPGRPRRPRIEIGGPGIGMPDAARDRPDEVTQTLDKIYGEADQFSKLLSTRTGGRSFKADTIASVNSAFAAIADELRNQYLIGYYSRSTGSQGKSHKIKVEVNRKDLQVRARSAYLEQ